MRKILTVTILFTFASLTAAGCAPERTADSTDAPSQSVEQSAEPSAPEEGQSEGSEAESGSESEGDSTEDSRAADQAAEGWTLGPESRAPSFSADDHILITGMRAGVHEGFDRLVVDFAGSGDLGWDARWVGQPIEQGRGERLDIEGPAYLDISIRGTSFPQTDADYEVYYDDHTGPSAGGIRSVYDSSFEGTTHIVIGTDAEAQFRVFQLQDPLRLVVDVSR